MKVFASWSGGKDSCLASYKATQAGMEVCYLVNMLSEDGTRSSSHGIDARLIAIQAQAMGLPILQQRTTFQTYEQAFMKAISSLKEDGIEAGIFGDMDVEEHRAWVERVCAQAGVKAYLPLWGQPQTQVLRDFIEAGFEAVVVATKADLMGDEWLGRRVDWAFYRDILGLEGRVTPCGEAGEYHTWVVDGPVFKSSVKVLESRKVQRDGHWYLEIPRYALVAKKRDGS